MFKEKGIVRNKAAEIMFFLNGRTLLRAAFLDIRGNWEVVKERKGKRKGKENWNEEERGSKNGTRSVPV